MKKITIEIEGMTCDHCVKAVTQVLKEFDGVTDVLVDLSKKSAQLSYDPEKATLSELTQAIEAEEYEVKGTH